MSLHRNPKYQCFSMGAPDQDYGEPAGDRRNRSLWLTFNKLLARSFRQIVQRPQLIGLAGRVAGMMVKDGEPRCLLFSGMHDVSAEKGVAPTTPGASDEFAGSTAASKIWRARGGRHRAPPLRRGGARLEDPVAHQPLAYTVKQGHRLGEALGGSGSPKRIPTPCEARGSRPAPPAGAEIRAEPRRWRSRRLSSCRKNRSASVLSVFVRARAGSRRARGSTGSARSAGSSGGQS